MYSQQFGRQTYKVEFIINPSLPHLGCSPDRRVQDDTVENSWGLLEIKCFMAEKLENLKHLKFLERRGKYKLKKVHKYYYQVMGCLALTGSQWCEFFVYCRQEFHCERIYSDSFFQKCKKNCTFVILTITFHHVSNKKYFTKIFILQLTYAWFSRVTC